MPAVSKAQHRFMRMVAAGILKRPGLSQEQAKEYISKNKGEKQYKKLPEKRK